METDGAPTSATDVDRIGALDLLEGGLGRPSGRVDDPLARHWAFIGDLGGFNLLVSLSVGGLGVYRLHKGKPGPAQGNAGALEAGLQPGDRPQ